MELDLKFGVYTSIKFKEVVAMSRSAFKLALGLFLFVGLLWGMSQLAAPDALACDDVIDCELKPTEPIILACDDSFGCDNDLKPTEPIV